MYLYRYDSCLLGPVCYWDTCPTASPMPVDSCLLGPVS